MYYANKGELFGLMPQDLTEHQLKKIIFEKLVEFLSKDSRVENILCEKMSCATVTEIRTLSYRNYTEVLRFPKLVEAYNNRITQLRKEKLPNDYYYSHDYVQWYLLNDENKLAELQKLVNKEESVASVSNLDVKWLYKTYPDIAPTIVDGLISKCSNHYGEKELCEKLMNDISSKEEIERIIPILKNKVSNESFIAILSNTMVPKEHHIAALRLLAKRVNSPMINITITQDILEAIPPITRLELLENIANNQRYPVGHKIFGNLKEDDLKRLLFSAVTKYSQRVETVLRRLKGVIQ